MTSWLFKACTGSNTAFWGGINPNDYFFASFSQLPAARQNRLKYINMYVFHPFFWVVAPYFVISVFFVENLAPYFASTTGDISAKHICKMLNVRTFFYVNVHLFIHAPPQMCIQIQTQQYCAQYMEVSACTLENTEQSVAAPQKTMGGSLEYCSPQFKPDLVMAFKNYMAKWSLQSWNCGRNCGIGK